MSTYNSVNLQRAKHWFRNTLKYYISKIFQYKRDKHLWVFSSWEGNKYSDNARFLFEYIRRYHPENTCIWQTKDSAVYKKLKSQNIPVQIIGSKESRRTQKKAGVAVFTNGIDDFGYDGDVFGAILVCLWHGFGLKRTYRQLYNQPNPIKRIFSNLKWDLFSWVKRDITIVVSEYTKVQFAAMFRLKKPQDILIAGQARYDAFSRKTSRESVFSSREIITKLDGKRIVLYMPTFREDSETMISQMKEILASEEINLTLRESNSILVMKLHYLNRGDISSTETSIILNDSDVTDNQMLLMISDILITDYSSCAIDFSLLDRPEIFFCPDWEKRKEDNSLIPETNDICSINRAITVDELNDVLQKTLKNPAKGLEQCARIRKYFCSLSIPPGRYSENNYETIIQRLGRRYI